MIGRRADNVAVRVMGSRIAAKIEESAESVFSKVTTDLRMSMGYICDL